uniref:DNA polymerase epsilon catalytic subunit n=1 Tax=Anopheles melas TaxID=34690 RepID=A0A182TKN8_9DIPT
MATKDLDAFNIQQLEMRPVSCTPYLKNSLNGRMNLRKIFLYQHVSPTGKREMWGLFSAASKKALVIVLDTCNVDYDNVEIEMRLLDVVQRKLMSYTLQDLRCIKCKQIKRENLSQYCTCTGCFENLICTSELRRLLQTFYTLAKDYRMSILEETVQHLLET